MSSPRDVSRATSPAAVPDVTALALAKVREYAGPSLYGYITTEEARALLALVEQTKKHHELACQFASSAIKERDEAQTELEQTRQERDEARKEARRRRDEQEELSQLTWRAERERDEAWYALTVLREQVPGLWRERDEAVARAKEAEGHLAAAEPYLVTTPGGKTNANARTFVLGRIQAARAALVDAAGRPPTDREEDS